jgi:hypothetical protein
VLTSDYGALNENLYVYKWDMDGGLVRICHLNELLGCYSVSYDAQSCVFHGQIGLFEDSSVQPVLWDFTFENGEFVGVRQAN